MTALRDTMGIFLRGVAMGAADIVPGVSGGTIALITGIYDRLVAAIAAANPSLLPLLFRGQFATIWRRVDGPFLLALIAGILTSVLVLAGAIQWLLNHHPLPLWSFFFGLVFASAFYLLREEVASFSARDALPLIIGIVLAAWIGLSPGMSFVDGALGFFLAGALAICAMILPGISGSFILLLLGMYQPVIRAIGELDLTVLLVFAAGCAVGLMSFSSVLHWILAHARRFTMALLSGFLLGSLVILWPWQVVVTSIIDRHGDARALQTLPVSPWTFAAEVAPNQWPICLALMAIGIAVVYVTHWLSSSRRPQLEELS